MHVEVFAPGRVNLIGDHTDYTGGVVLPMAIQLGIAISGERAGSEVRLTSALQTEAAVVPLDVSEPCRQQPRWAAYVAGVVAELKPQVGFEGVVESTLPVAAGLSSSAALEIAVALALGFEGTPTELALLAQRAEWAASGVPCGIMDQLTSAAGRHSHALLIDCNTLAITPVALPDAVDVVVVHSGQARALADSAYAERRSACEAAAALIGPLNAAASADLDRIGDRVVAARARHVIGENERVRRFAMALAGGDLTIAGQLMTASHASLRDDFEVSTPALDGLVDRLHHTPGVYGARLTGAGFGGCTVALCAPGALADLIEHGPERAWLVQPSPGATVRVSP